MDYLVLSKFSLKCTLDNLEDKEDQVMVIHVNQNKSPKRRHSPLWEQSRSPLIPLSNFRVANMSKQYDLNMNAETTNLLDTVARKKELEP